MLCFCCNASLALSCLHSYAVPPPLSCLHSYACTHMQVEAIAPQERRPSDACNHPQLPGNLVCNFKHPERRESAFPSHALPCVSCFPSVSSLLAMSLFLVVQIIHFQRHELYLDTSLLILKQLAPHELYLDTSLLILKQLAPLQDT